MELDIRIHVWIWIKTHLIVGWERDLIVNIAECELGDWLGLGGIWVRMWMWVIVVLDRYCRVTLPMRGWARVVVLIRHCVHLDRVVKVRLRYWSGIATGL